MELKNYDKEERFDPATVEALKGHYAGNTAPGRGPRARKAAENPERVAKPCRSDEGYTKNPLEIIRSATFREEYKQMVLVKDIELYSICEHHMPPFYGKAHVAYIPNGASRVFRRSRAWWSASPAACRCRERLTGADPRLHSRPSTRWAWPW